MTIADDTADLATNLMVRPLSAHIGAEIRGIDLRDVDDETVAAIRQLPESGGDTMWSRQVTAFAALSPTLQQFLEGLTAVHDGRAQFGAALKARPEGGEWDGEVYASLDPVEHPVVISHPESGERAPYVNPGFTSHIVQLDRAESDAPLAFLHAHSVRPEYTVRHHWSPGDLGFWDNRVTQHSVVGDFGDRHRVIQRITLRGQKPSA